MKKPKIIHYKDGIEIRRNNSQILFTEKKTEFELTFKTFVNDKNGVNSVSTNIRGIAFTKIKLSKEAVEMISYALLKYLNQSENEKN